MEVLAGAKSLEAAQIYVIAAAIALARMTGMIMIMPVFQRLALTGILKGTVALVFAMPVIPFIVGAITAEPLTAGRLMAIMLKEVAVGITIGFVLGIPIWAAEVAGDILDLQRGSSFATLVDPSTGGESTVLSTLLAITIVALFLAIGGLTLTLKTVYGSYALWPMNQFLPLYSADAGMLFLGLLDEVMRMGLMLVAPLVMALLLADFALALVARAAQHLHVFDLSLSVKNLALTILFVLYGSFLFSYMKDDLRWMAGVNARLEAISAQGAKK